MLRHLSIYLTLFGLALPLQNCNTTAAKNPEKACRKAASLVEMDRLAYKFYRQKRWADALPIYLKAAKEAADTGDSEFATKCLINAGANQLLTFRYQDALTTMERARKVAEESGNRDYVAYANANIVSLYLQMSNLAGASVAAQRAMAELRDSNPFYANVVLPVAQLRAELHDMAGAEILISKVIDGAYRAGVPEVAAWAWDYLGYRYEIENRIAEADAAATEALRLRKMFQLAELCSSYLQLAKIRIDQGDLRSAAALLDAAVGELKSPGNGTPAWYIYLERGRLFQKAGNREAAWKSLGKAVSLARNWRTEVVANDANRTSAEAALSQLYSLYIDVGNELRPKPARIWPAIRSKPSKKIARPVSGRSPSEKSDGTHNCPLLTGRLSNGYNPPKETRSGTIRPKTEPPFSTFVPFSTKWRPPPALRTPLWFVRQWKRPRTNWMVEAYFLAFNWESALRGSGRLRRMRCRFSPFLQGRFWLRKLASSRNAYAVRRRRPIRGGAALYSLLFAQVPERLKRPERWIFSLDQELFSLPLPALVMRYVNGEPEYLGISRALGATPGALIYAAALHQTALSGPLLAIGDGIYNRADSRLQSPVFLQAGFGPPLTATEKNDAFRFARLWGAEEEIVSVKKAWGNPDSVALSGSQISREKIWSQLDKRPAVIHFATHILEANDQLHTGWIALSLTPDGNSEFLSPSDISAHKITAGLVVLNGCSSGNGEIRAASGLMGLTRAWIAAGASEVVATRWPGPDDPGIFFGEFYRNLKTNPEMGSAFALRAAFEAVFARVAGERVPSSGPVIFSQE